MVRTAMSGERHQPDEFDESDQRSFADAAWSIPSYLMSGMMVYGGIGWLLDRWLGLSALFPIGILLGLGLALYLVYVRFGR
ncbi:MAG: AtpZ/AtpI family protein [Actinomadura sp.]